MLLRLVSRSDWDEAYSTPSDTQELTGGKTYPRKTLRLHYHRYVHMPHAQKLADKIEIDFNITTEDRILVVGCGFGWLVEALSARCMKAVGTELSPWIHEAKDTSEKVEITDAMVTAGIVRESETWNRVLRIALADGYRTAATILREDSLSAVSRNNVVQELGGDPDIVITEEVLNMLDEEETARLTTALSLYEGALIHIVNGGIV